MGKYFTQNTPLAGLERLMMTPPNFIPRGSGTMVLCRFRYGPDDVDCRNCLQYQRRSCSKPRCPYLTERLEAGTATLEELAQELVRPWEHWGLKCRVVQLARRAGRFLFDGQLHIARMLKLTEGERNVSSRWTAAVYLLSSNATLWQRIRPAVKPGQIIFDAVKPGNASVKEYTIYRAAKGIYHGRASALLMAAEGNGFDDVALYYDHLMEHLQWKNLGKVLCGGVMNVGDIADRPEISEACELGKSIK